MGRTWPRRNEAKIYTFLRAKLTIEYFSHRRDLLSQVTYEIQHLGSSRPVLLSFHTTSKFNAYRLNPAMSSRKPSTRPCRFDPRYPK